MVFIISERVGVRRGKPPVKQTPLNWPYSSRRFRPLVTRDGETPSEGFLLMKTTRFLAGPPSKSDMRCQGRGTGCASAEGNGVCAVEKEGVGSPPLAGFRRTE